jgi:hypothetical protein
VVAAYSLVMADKKATLQKTTTTTTKKNRLTYKKEEGTMDWKRREAREVKAEQSLPNTSS